MDTGELNRSRETTPHSGRMISSRKRLLGDLLIKEGLITKAQLQEALRLQKELETYQPIGQILVNQQVLTQKQVNFILEKYHKKYRLGDLLVEIEAITEDQLEIALDHQRKTDLRLGEVLLQLNLLTERELVQALCAQLNVTFIDLDGCVIDPSLSGLIYESYARHHRLIPIAIEKRLTLAMDDPADLEVIDELRASTGCRIDVVTSTRAAFDRAFSRLYGDSRGPGSEHQLQELREAQERLRREHDATTRALADLRVAHEVLLQEQERARKRFES